MKEGNVFTQLALDLSPEEFFAQVLDTAPEEMEKLKATGINLMAARDACIKTCNDVDRLIDDNTKFWVDACSTDQCKGPQATMVMVQLLNRAAEYQVQARIHHFVAEIHELLSQTTEGLAELIKMAREAKHGRETRQ